MTHRQGTLLGAVLLASIAATSSADCSGGCHSFASCEESTCVCFPGLIDESPSGQSGQACNPNGFSVRYVIDEDPGSNPTASLNHTQGMAKCAPSAQAYFVRSVDGMTEVNCIYSVANTPSDTSEYGTTTSPEGTQYTVLPSIYRWVLPTTGSPFDIPPTGMTVSGVHFKPSCAKSGCWVVEGIVTIGEAFNTFGSFNSFYLPQTNLNWQDSQACDMAFSRDGTATCWHILPSKMDYADAVSECAAAYDGIPATIHGSFENVLFRDIVRQSNLGSTWLAFTDQDVEGTFAWIDNSTVDYTNWNGGNTAPNNQGEDCTEFRTNGRWYDRSCTGTRSVVCEISAPEEYPEAGGALSFDYDYSASEWTYLPAQHPCTSANYDAGSDGTSRISTCCMTNSKVGPTGGFIANYRPTQQFVDWAGTLTCDVGFDRNTTGTMEPKCWKFYDQNVHYSVAQARCAAAGGKVAEIHSQEEQDRLQHWRFVQENNRPIWVALTDIENEGDFVLPDGSEPPYTNWNNNEPQNNTGNEDCTEVTGSGGWKSRSCTSSRRFMCEFVPPVLDRDCVEHVIQRPDFTKPEGDTPCWMVSTEKKNFADAEQDCIDRGGAIASIEDDEENWFFRRLITYKGVSRPWIGITDRDEEGNFTWADGSEVTFTNWRNGEPDNNNNNQDCTQMQGNGLWRDYPCTQSRGYVCELPRTTPDMECDSDTVENLDPDFDVVFPSDRVSFLHVGGFKGMPDSPGIVSMQNLDPFFGQFGFTIELDEVELRSKAGQLRGTVGVEHTVDTFLGLANFRPTGTNVIDTFAIQTALHLEKTSFFTVSTHGTNDYTFLEYVNLRLVAVYQEDADFSGTAESDDRTVRTGRTDAAHYIQVTFTLGSQYKVNTNDGLIPLSSVRAGEGEFLSDADMEHKCLQWAGIDGSFDGGSLKLFNQTLGQTCAPAAAMCTSPSAIPDSFVSFNIPLGVDFFNAPSDMLSENVFVDMVISAIEDASGTPNAGDDPKQMKTTLTASIPVVEGGVNIFCDGYTAKTDLKDVANADMVVGTASSSDELTRLRIKENIASTQLSASAITPIDSDSIEAGLMTLVLKGDASYFESNTGRDEVTVELEDVITIHIMESDTGAGADADVSSSVLALITSAPDDNTLPTGLDTDGYALNGAFFFTIDRSAQRAHLEPSEELLEVCPFNPPRPANSLPLETCITRRDVRYRGFPWRNGAKSTAMEICVGGTCPAASATDSSESDFMVSVLGDSDYARGLGVSYAGVIDAKYELNGRYRRAYWINPGYEWTPTQTGGTPLFSVSQQLYLFALITLDEGLATGDDGASLANGQGPSLRRRMLLQSTPEEGLQDGQSSLNAQGFEFQTTPISIMAHAYDVPEDRVATFAVTLQLTAAEACMAPTDLQASIRSTLDDYLRGAASALETVQVAAMSVQRGDSVQCGRRALRALLASESTAAVTMMVVFSKGTQSALDLAKLQTMPGIHAVQPLTLSPKIDTAPDAIADPYDGSSDSSDGSSSNTALIGGIAGGVGGVLLLAGGAMLWMRSRAEPVMVNAVPAISVEDLKVQLGADV